MSSNNGDPAQHIQGFDSLRAFFSICVVAVHSGYVAPSGIFDRSRCDTHQFSWSDFVNFYVLLLAVPVFALISCFLMAMRPSSDERLIQRVMRTSKLLLFWTLLLHVCDTGLLAATDRVASELRHNPIGFVLTGGDTIFYFFASLIVLLVVTSFAKRISDFANWVLLVAAFAIVAVLPLAAVSLNCPALVHHANPLNFLPLAFGAVAMQSAPFLRDGKRRILPALVTLVAACLAAMLDWSVYKHALMFEVESFAIPAQTRPSLVLLAMAVVQMSALVRFPAAPIVRFMSRHSLALYCIHPFVLTIVYRILPRLHMQGNYRFTTCVVMTLGSSYVLALILPAVFRRELLS
jgi:peptidoglycan/LPS O-acetylase OafA/YrhL